MSGLMLRFTVPIGGNYAKSMRTIKKEWRAPEYALVYLVFYDTSPQSLAHYSQEVTKIIAALAETKLVKTHHPDQLIIGEISVRQDDRKRGVQITILPFISELFSTTTKSKKHSAVKDLLTGSCNQVHNQGCDECPYGLQKECFLLYVNH